MPTALLDLPLEVLTGVCQLLDFRDPIRVAETCNRFRHGDGALKTAELPTKSPVGTALREHALPGGVGMARWLLRVVGGVPGAVHAAGPLPGGAAHRGGQ
jgi:hypothetical protein